MNKYIHEFEETYHKAERNDRLARWRNRPNTLLSYQAVRSNVASIGECYRGVQTVQVEYIVGSTDRWLAFDTKFRPLQQNSAGRWASVARGYSEGLSLPPVELFQIANEYFVRDGHHRVSVARTRGQCWIDAEVIEVIVVPSEQSIQSSVFAPAESNCSRPKRLASFVLSGLGRRPRLARTT